MFRGNLSHMFPLSKNFLGRKLLAQKNTESLPDTVFFTCALAIPLLAIRPELWNSSEKKKNFSFPLPDRGKFPKDSFGSRVRQKRKGEGEREGEKGK